MQNSVVVVVVALVLLTGCAGAQPEPAATPAPPTTAIATTPPPPPPLFERLGGKAALEAVVDQFLANVAADDRVNYRFAFSDLGRLRGHLVDQLCAATGGPCTYTGRNMKDTHRGQRIDEAGWVAVVDDLVAALDHFHVPAAEKGELMAALAPMHDDIVEVAP